MRVHELIEQLEEHHPDDWVDVQIYAPADAADRNVQAEARSVEKRMKGDKSSVVISSDA